MFAKIICRLIFSFKPKTPLKDLPILFIKSEMQNEFEKRYCQYEHCKSKHKAMPPIFNKRMNGTDCRSDWKGRPYHKKCWKEMEESQRNARVLTQNIFN